MYVCVTASFQRSGYYLLPNYNVKGGTYEIFSCVCVCVRACVRDIIPVMQFD